MADTSYADPISLLLLFLVLHLLAGALLPFRRGRKPFVWNFLDGFTAEVERRLNRRTRTASDRVVRGFAVTILLAFFALGAGYGIDRLGQYPFGWVASLLLLMSCISVMGPLKVLRVATRRLSAEDTAGAIAVLQPVYDGDLSQADRHAVIRQALEFGAVRLNQYFIGPVLAFVFLKSPGLLFYVAVMAFYDACGRNLSTSLYFGGTVRALEKLVNTIPSFVTAAAIWLSTFVVAGTHPVEAARAGWTQAGEDKWKNRGRLVAALAGAVGVTLGGAVRRLDGSVDNRGWVGATGSTAQAGLKELKRGTMIFFIVFICTIIALSGAFMMLDNFT